MARLLEPFKPVTGTATFFNLCAKKRRVKLNFTSQTGRTQNTELAIAIAGCRK